MINYEAYSLTKEAHEETSEEIINKLLSMKSENSIEARAWVYDDEYNNGKRVYLFDIMYGTYERSIHETITLIDEEDFYNRFAQTITDPHNIFVGLPKILLGSDITYGVHVTNDKVLIAYNDTKVMMISSGPCGITLQ